MEIQLEVLRRLYRSPVLSQRVVAKELGVSLGSINYCFQALVDKGWIKMQNFSQSNQKFRYAYLLTPSGIFAKSKLTTEFIKQKSAEYEALHRQIEQLKAEIENDQA
jgi:EPS-associated MarR family transcriptional regulator